MKWADWSRKVPPLADSFEKAQGLLANLFVGVNKEYFSTDIAIQRELLGLVATTHLIIKEHNNLNQSLEDLYIKALSDAIEAMFADKKISRKKEDIERVVRSIKTTIEISLDPTQSKSPR